jgi:uncharacterized protein YjbI with pentapeptide repeats
LPGADFTRAVLASSDWHRSVADRAIFEFADFSSAELRESNFAHASFMGARLASAKATHCDFHAVDFFWADLASLHCEACRTDKARLPQEVSIAASPRGLERPAIEPRPLHRVPISAAELQALLAVLS